MKKTIDELVVDFLSSTDGERAIHEINIAGYSQSSIGAALRRTTNANKTYRIDVAGKRFKKWGAVPVSDYNFNTKA